MLPKTVLCDITLFCLFVTLVSSTRPPTCSHSIAMAWANPNPHPYQIILDEQIYDSGEFGFTILVSKQDKKNSKIWGFNVWVSNSQGRHKGYLRADGVETKEIYCSENSEVYSLGIINKADLNADSVRFIWEYYGDPPDANLQVKINASILPDERNRYILLSDPIEVRNGKGGPAPNSCALLTNPFLCVEPYEADLGIDFDTDINEFCPYLNDITQCINYMRSKSVAAGCGEDGGEVMNRMDVCDRMDPIDNPPSHDSGGNVSGSGGNTPSVVHSDSHGSGSSTPRPNIDVCDRYIQNCLAVRNVPVPSKTSSTVVKCRYNIENFQCASTMYLDCGFNAQSIHEKYKNIQKKLFDSYKCSTTIGCGQSLMSDCLGDTNILPSYENITSHTEESCLAFNKVLNCISKVPFSCRSPWLHQNILTEMRYDLLTSCATIRQQVEADCDLKLRSCTGITIFNYLLNRVKDNLYDEKYCRYMPKVFSCMEQLSFTCPTQLYSIAHAIPDPSDPHLDTIISCINNMGGDSCRGPLNACTGADANDYNSQNTKVKCQAYHNSWECVKTLKGQNNHCFDNWWNDDVYNRTTTTLSHICPGKYDNTLIMDRPIKPRTFIEESENPWEVAFYILLVITIMIILIIITDLIIRNFSSKTESTRSYSSLKGLRPVGQSKEFKPISCLQVFNRWKHLTSGKLPLGQVDQIQWGLFPYGDKCLVEHVILPQGSEIV